MKKILFLLPVVWIFAIVAMAQPISGIPDKGFYPEDTGRIFTNDYKIYESVTRFYPGWDGGFFCRFQNIRGMGMTSGFSGPDTINQVTKDLGPQNFIYFDKKQNRNYSNTALFDNGHSKGTVKTENNKYYSYWLNGNTIRIKEINSNSTAGSQNTSIKHFLVPTKLLGGNTPLGGHNNNSGNVRFWISVDPEFAGQQEFTSLALFSQNLTVLRKRANHSALSIQNSFLDGSKRMWALGAYRNGAERKLRVLVFDSLLNRTDSFEVTNSSGFVRSDFISVDAQNRTTIGFEINSGGTLTYRIVRYLNNGNVDPGFSQIVQQNTAGMMAFPVADKFRLVFQQGSFIRLLRYSGIGQLETSSNFFCRDGYIMHKPFFRFDENKKVIFESLEPINYKSEDLVYPYIFPTPSTKDSTITFKNRFILDLEGGIKPLLQGHFAMVHDAPFRMVNFTCIPSKKYKKLSFLGSFSHIQGTLRPRFAVVNPNGTVDTSYLPVSSYPKNIQDSLMNLPFNNIRFELLANKKILVWGRIDFCSNSTKQLKSMRLSASGIYDSTYNNKREISDFYHSDDGGFYALIYEDSLGNPCSKWEDYRNPRFVIQKLDSVADVKSTLPVLSPAVVYPGSHVSIGEILLEDNQGGLWVNIKTGNFPQDPFRIGRFHNGKWKIFIPPAKGNFFKPVSITTLSNGGFRIIGTLDSSAIINGFPTPRNVAHNFYTDSNLVMITDGSFPKPKLLSKGNQFSNSSYLYIHYIQQDGKLIVTDSYFGYGTLIRFLSNGRIDPSFLPINQPRYGFHTIELLGNRLFIANHGQNVPSYIHMPVAYNDYPGSSRKNGLHSFLTNSSLQPENFALGRVAQVPNTDNTCNPNPAAKSLAMKMIESAPTGRITFTDTGGFYNLVLPQGQHSIKQIIQGHELQRQTCPLPAAPEYSVNFTGTGLLEVDKDFKNQTYNCTKLGVGLFTGRNRLCSKRQYDITYSNDGLTSEPNARIRLWLPMYVSLFSASRPYTITPDSAIVFALGNLGPGQTGIINIVDSVHCINGLNGTETGCVSARIEPLELCGAVTPSSINWNGAWLDAKATTLSTGGPVRIAMYSKGASMTDSTKFRIAVGSFVREGKLKLQSGDSLVIISPPMGMNMVYLSLEQPKNCPAGTSSSLSHNGRKDAVTFLSFENGWFQFQNHTFCDVYRFSYDPNEKVVEPKQDINPGNILTYTIHFENYGNDTAYAVAIADTFSANLDFRSFNFLESSHPCTPLIDQNGPLNIINFMFNPIKLTAKKQDSVASKGYVRFTMNSKTDLLPGDEIKNTAHIYFDRNPAIVTNTVVSKIYTPPSPTALDKTKKSKGLSLFPNPAKNSVWLDLPDAEKSESVKVFDVKGVLMLESKFNAGELNIQCLKPGIYVVKVGNWVPQRLVVTQ
jgi:uncharacterized repeat protein (TIGR01451 family)